MGCCQVVRLLRCFYAVTSIFWVVASMLYSVARGFLKCGCMLHFCAAARMFWVVTRVLLCSYYNVLDVCRGIAMQLLRCSELLLAY